MKCRIMQLLSGTSLLAMTKTIFSERNTIFFDVEIIYIIIYTIIDTMDHIKFIASNQKGLTGLKK